MLTATGCKERRNRLWARLPDRPDWIIISDPSHLVYLANYVQSPFVFRSNDARAVLILGADGSSTLFADNLLQPFLDQAHVDEVVAPVWYRSVESAPHRAEFLVRNVRERLARCQGRHFGIEPGSLPAGIAEALAGVRVTNVEPVLVALRRQKDADELALIRASMRAAEAGMAAGLAGIRPGMAELDAYLLVEQAVQHAAGAQVRVYGDFVSGPRCEQIGGPPSARRIEKGDLVLLDFSAVIHGYRGDFANTFVCDGQPTIRQRELFEACLAAMQAGEKVLRAGVSGRDVYQAVRAAFDARRLAASFPHHAGHGISLGHPEPPYLVPGSNDVLQTGDVVTLEPGQYIPGVAGMRYERNYLIKEDGFELLSHHALTID